MPNGKYSLSCRHRRLAERDEGALAQVRAVCETVEIAPVVRGLIAMNATSSCYVVVDVDGRVCPDQRKGARNSIDFRAARALNVQATGTTRLGRTVRTALATTSIADLIALARSDVKLGWPLSVYEISGDRDSEFPRDSRVRRLDGINVHREVPAANLFGPRGDDVVDLIEKLYYMDRSELSGAARAKRIDTFTNVMAEFRPEHSQAKARLRGVAETVGLEGEMYLANQLASRAAGLSVSFFDTLTGYPFTDIGCAAAATVVRDHLNIADYTTLTRPVSATLRGS